MLDSGALLSIPLTMEACRSGGSQLAPAWHSTQQERSLLDFASHTDAEWSCTGIDVHLLPPYTMTS